MNYIFKVNVTWIKNISVPSTSDTSYGEAVEKLKDTFEETYGFRPNDNEIEQITKEEL